MDIKLTTILGTFPMATARLHSATHNTAEAGAGHDSHMRKRNTMSVGTGSLSERELQDNVGYHVLGLRHVSGSKADGQCAQSGRQPNLHQSRLPWLEPKWLRKN